MGGQTVPVLSSGYKYRVGYNSSSAYCPYTTAKENATFWQYLYRDSFSKKSKMKLIRYKNFYYWADKNTQLFSDCPNISSEHGKMGHWIPYGKAPSATSVETYGAMYTITLDDGKTYPMYVSYLEDYKKSGSERISLNVDKIAQYMIYQGNRKLKALGKI